MLNKLKGWLVKLPIGTKKGGRILMLNSAGSVDLNKVYDEMEKEITGVKRETIVHVVTLFLRVVAQLILNGYSVNAGTVPCRGTFQRNDRRWSMESG